MQKLIQPLLNICRRQTKLAIGITVGLVIGGVSSAAVIAAVPDTSGVIHACYRTNKGALTIIDPATQSCPSGETAISWNQTGPQGPSGAGSGNGFVSNLVGADFSGASLQYRNLSNLDSY